MYCQAHGIRFYEHTAFDESTITDADIAERYLSEPECPMRNEDYYIVFLEKLLSMPDFEEEQLLRPRTQLERVMKNRPGDTATDFRFTTREGQQESLSDVQADLLLLIFYDPEFNIAYVMGSICHPYSWQFGPYA